MSKYSARQKAWIDLVGRTDNVTLGWPREVYSRPVKGRWKCRDCDHEWLEYTTGSGTFTADDFNEDCCPECGSMNSTVRIEDDWQPEPGSGDSEFSWQECDLCGCPLGGRRHPATILPEDSTSTNYTPIEVCTDCVFYLEYGDVPDDEYLEWV